MEQNTTERKNKERVVADMVKLLDRSPEEGLTWLSSKTDLIEMVHIMYCADVVKDSEGLPVTFRELVRRVCSIVHVTVPCNPNQLVVRAQQRKGRRVLPLLLRYKGLAVVW